MRIKRLRPRDISNDNTSLLLQLKEAKDTIARLTEDNKKQEELLSAAVAEAEQATESMYFACSDLVSCKRLQEYREIAARADLWMRGMKHSCSGWTAKWEAQIEEEKAEAELSKLPSRLRDRVRIRERGRRQ